MERAGILEISVDEAEARDASPALAAALSTAVPRTASFVPAFVDDDVIVLLERGAAGEPTTLVLSKPVEKATPIAPPRGGAASFAAGERTPRRAEGPSADDDDAPGASLASLSRRGRAIATGWAPDDVAPDAPWLVRGRAVIEAGRAAG